MSNNSSKQLILSVIGVAILIISVVGVSFAIFSYARSGKKTNQIYTGSINFVFEDGDQIYLKNQFPVTSSAVIDLDKDEIPAENHNTATIHISGSVSSGTLYYKVFIFNPDQAVDSSVSSAVDLSTSTTYTTNSRMPDSTIYLYTFADNNNQIEYTAARNRGGQYFGIDNHTGLTDPNGVGAAIGNVDTNTRVLLATVDPNSPTSKELVGYGAITSGMGDVSTTISFKAYVSSDSTEIISDADDVLGTRYDSTTHKMLYTQADYGHKYYSFRFRVETNSDSGTWSTTAERNKIINYDNNTW